MLVATHFKLDFFIFSHSFFKPYIFISRYTAEVRKKTILNKIKIYILVFVFVKKCVNYSAIYNAMCHVCKYKP